MKTGEKGINLIKKHEGFRNNAYLCPAGVWTIGWGNTFYADGEPVKEGDFIYSRDADKLLLAILSKFENSVSAMVKVPLEQHQFDALVSLCYNIGARAFRESTLLRWLNAGAEPNEIIQQILRWNKAGGVVLKGLKKRRNQEAYLYNGEKPWK